MKQDRLAEWFRLFASTLVLVASTGCVDRGGGGLPLLIADESPDAVRAEYRLAPGDKLKVAVFGAQEFSGEITVNDMGKLPMSLIGDVPVTGLTPSETAEALKARFARGFLRNPNISVEVVSYRPIYIFGEVTKPGEYRYVPGMTLLNAVSVGGGYTYRAAKDHAIVVRHGKEYRASVAAPLLPDDIVRVPERFL